MCFQLRSILIYFLWIIYCSQQAFSCTSTTTQYKRSGGDVTIPFQAKTVNSENSALIVTNQILSIDGSPLFSAIYRNGVITYTSTCAGCTFTGNAATGDLSIRLQNIQTSQGGTYKHTVTESSREVKGCVLIYILGEPTKPSITVNKVPFEGESVTLTCSSTSTTIPKNLNLRMMYSWKVDNNIPSDTRYKISDTKYKLTISNVKRNDANKQFTCTAKEDVGNAITSISSETQRLDVYYKPDIGPFVEGTFNSFNNNTLYLAIVNRQQILTCAVIGGYPLPSLSWSCFTGSGKDMSSGQNSTKTWTWTASSGGTCKCTSTQTGSTDTFLLDVRILSPPTSPTFNLYSQTVQPLSTVKILIESTAPITCSSTSFPSPEYKWTYNGRITKVSQEATLNPSHITQDGRYYCNVQNTMTPSQGNPETGRNSAFINIERLSPPSKPKLRYHNISGDVLTGSFKVVRGDDINMYCSSRGNPSPTYLWTGDGRNIQHKIIAVSTITQERRYTCKVTNTMNPTFLSNVTRSSSSTVYVSVLSPATSPTIRYHYSQSGSTSVTSTLKVIKGKSFRVSCASTGIPTPTLSWSGPVDSNIDTLTLTSIQNEGIYNCSASNYMNRTFGRKVIINSTSSLHIQILYAPTVKSFDIEPIVEGSPLSVDCKVDPGIPADTKYSWKRKLISSSIKSWQDIPNSSLNGGLLHIKNITRNDDGTYKCIASNIMKPTAKNQQIGSSFQTFLLNVLYKTSITRFFEVNEPTKTEVTRNENSPVNLTCLVDSNPGSIISIFKDGTSIKTVDESKRISFIDERASCDSAGTYSCVGYNQYNVDDSRPSKKLHLFVTCKPRLSSEKNFHGQVRSAIGEKAILEIQIKAYPVPDQDAYVWSKRIGDKWEILTEDENMKINTYGLDSSLVFLGVKFSDFQQYSVNITNDYGTIHQEFFLQPYGKPNPPINVHYIESSIKQRSVGITWNPGFHGGLNQTFHILFKRQSDSDWQEVTKPDVRTTSMNTTLEGLEPGTTYVFLMFSSNSEGNSNVTATSSFTTLGKPSTLDSQAGLIGGVISGIITVVAAILIVGIYIFRNNDKHKGCFRQKEESRKSDSNDYYMNLQNMEGGSQMNKNQELVNTSHDEMIPSRETNVYTQLQTNVNDGTEHIYKSLEQKSLPKEDSKVYENLKLR